MRSGVEGRRVGWIDAERTSGASANVARAALRWLVMVTVIVAFVVAATARPSGQMYFGTWSTGWMITSGDMNGDRVDDLFLYNPESGEYYTAIDRHDGTYAYAFGTWSPGWDQIMILPPLLVQQRVLVYDADTGVALVVYFDHPGLSGPGGSIRTPGMCWDDFTFLPGRVLSLRERRGASIPFDHVHAYDPLTGMWIEYELPIRGCDTTGAY